jgi:hypothetical protein
MSRDFLDREQRIALSAGQLPDADQVAQVAITALVLSQ